MPKLTGEQRLQLVIAWIKRGRDMPKEDFIKKVCKLKGIEYVEPTEVNRNQYPKRDIANNTAKEQ